jgi:hypothetical protein
LLVWLFVKRGWLGPYSHLGDRIEDWHYLPQAGLFLLVGLSVAALALIDLREYSDEDSWLLVLWAAGTFVFAAGVNWVINGRSLLPLAPAAGILLARRLDRLRGPQTGSWVEMLPLVPAGALALWVTLADQSLAESERGAARAVAGRCSGQHGTIWFEGHWGFQYYLEGLGGHHTDCTDYHFKPGDFIILPENNYATRFEPQPGEVQELPAIEQPLFPGLTTMSMETGAGFYSHSVGPLPFVIGPAAPVNFRVLQFRALPEKR